ncbi:MAG: hypothetical protein M3154_11580, partial [Candidatus Eremiobacteraeota bacterium]|nr:hypothetical protein [Candidatus Eremiobacteraeota bacterium]
VFGGDVALPAPDAPVLIDLNDWPSFAPFRADAAAAIAAYALRRAADAFQAPDCLAHGRLSLAGAGTGATRVRRSGHAGRIYNDFA